MSEALELRLLNEFQRDFPLCPEPFVELARELETDEVELLLSLRHLQEEGIVSRLGAVFSPRRIGASTLAALAIPPENLDAIADDISAYPEVNHNYERENHWNLWLVATAPSSEHLDQVLTEIARQAKSPLIRLPLLEEFHIDLGFDLTHGKQGLYAKSPASKVVHRPAELPESAWQLTAAEEKLMAALQDGLPLELRPYASLAERTGLTETEVLDYLQSWLARGLVKRFGIIVRHHELGWTANAMCVWDVPDDQVSQLGEHLAQQADVTLCYRRARDLPAWPYNLYCMIHGRERSQVEARIQTINNELNLRMYPHQILFSLRRYKQRGARYIDVRNGAGHA